MMMIYQIVAVLSIILVIFMFIGYWTYADYYTKLSSTFRKVFWFVHVVVYVISGEIFFVGYGKESLDAAILLASGSITLFYILVLIISLIVLVVKGFIKSHQYFGKKRNKI